MKMTSRKFSFLRMEPVTLIHVRKMGKTESWAGLVILVFCMNMYNQSLRYKCANIGNPRFRGLEEIIQWVPWTQDILLSIIVILEKKKNKSVMSMHTGDKLIRLFEYSYPCINEGYKGSGNSSFLVVIWSLIQYLWHTNMLFHISFCTCEWSRRLLPIGTEAHALFCCLSYQAITMNMLDSAIFQPPKSHIRLSAHY